MVRHVAVTWILTTLCICHLHGHTDRTNSQLVQLLKKIVEEEEKYSETRAKQWLEGFNEGLRQTNHMVALAEYEYNTDLSQEKSDQFTTASVDANEWMKGQAKQAKLFLKGKSKDDFEDPSVFRMLSLLTCSSAVSDEEAVNKRISELTNKLGEIYGTTLIEGHTLDDLETYMANVSSQDRLRYWVKWRDAVGPQMKPLYTELIHNLNIAARENGFSDIGEPWRNEDFGYETKNLEAMAEEIFNEIKPLYLELHAYVRRILYNKYPEANIDLKGPIPAHLLGNMWAQQWIIEGFRPYPDQPEVDITDKLKDKYTPHDMFVMAEDFFTSIGLEKMTHIFWDNSMISRPDDREVQCHASASDLFSPGDYRIKMCTKLTQDDLAVIHHEMGHIEYFMEYSHQPAIFRTGANAAFHEAIGDTIALSVNTATHFETMGLLESFTQNHESDINSLMKMAFEKVAFLPFGYLIDRYRWEVFRGNIDETNYNSKWWDLRKELQGVAAPVERTEDDFDPGAKYHIATNVPYIRYLFAHFAEFDFYEQMCKKSGHEGPIHRCDFYNSKEAGALLKSMLELGASEEWQVAMEKMTGKRDFSAKPMINYFKPLYEWLKIENKKNGEFIGWI